MQAEERWKKARVRFELSESERECWVTHWVSTRSEGDGLHVMIGDYLWRKKKDRKREGEDTERETEGEHVGDMKYVGSEMRARGWRHKCGIITEKSAFLLR